MKTEDIYFTRVNNDVNGNPRYVCHFLIFLTDKDDHISIMNRYALALNRAKRIGGHKFHNKQYGGGIVFQSYSIESTKNSIVELVKEFE